MELGQSLHRGIRAWKFILVHHNLRHFLGGGNGERNNLVPSDPFFIGIFQTLLTSGSKLVCLFSGHTPFSGHAIADLDHGDILFLVGG